MGKRATKTGDEAGITKNEQRIVLADDFYLYDTPGMLWPKITVPETGYLLAASGAVGRNAYDEEEVALELLKVLQQPYAHLLEARYKWGYTPQAISAMPDHELLDAVGRKRGALMPGGRINTQKAAEAVLNDFRSATLGHITLETPTQFLAWQAAAVQQQAQREAQRLQRQTQRRSDFQASAQRRKKT